jgi:hypothetical protein
MPVAEHKDWCSILRGQVERERRESVIAPSGRLETD